MTLFDRLVDQALYNQPEWSPLRSVVEKELLHHDILRILSHSNLLKDLTFIGGTALRACYGGVRLSEDLDFTGGQDFSRDQLKDMGHVLVESLAEKYGLKVSVSEPFKDTTLTDTWKVKVETRPASVHLPAQRIHIDICSVPSYDRRPMLLLNPYGVEMGTSGLILQTQSREEIYTDKLLAFALRPNRVKHRDLWDMVWLHQQRIQPNLAWIDSKLKDRDIAFQTFIDAFQRRAQSLSTDPQLEAGFKQEMQRFLPPQILQNSINQGGFWGFMTGLMGDWSDKLLKID